MRKIIHKAGFTLLEIVVAVAIFGVIAAIIFPALLQFLDIRERVDEKHQHIIALQKTFLFMANDFRYIANRPTKDEYGELGKQAFKLKDDNLFEMVSLYADVSLGGLNVPRKVVWNKEKDTLVREQYPVMDPDRDTKPTVQHLLTGVEKVAVVVHHIDNGRDNKSSKWKEVGAVPDLIDITITMQNDVKYQRLFNLTGANDKQFLPFSQPANGGNNGPNDGQTQGNGSPSPTQ